MNRHLRKALQARRAIVQRRLNQALLDGEEIANLEQIAAEISAYDNLVEKIRKPALPPWITTMSIAATACALLAIGFAFHLPAPIVELDAAATEVSWHSNKEVDLNGDALLRTRTFHGGPYKDERGVERALTLSEASDASGISLTKLAAGSRIVVQTTEANCYAIRLISGYLTGQLRGPLKDGDSMPSLQTITLGQGGEIRFCATDGLSLIVPTIDDLVISSIKRLDPPPRLYAPSIVSGTLLIPAVGYSRKLTDTDRVSLGGIENGRLILMRHDKMRLVFGGNVKRPKLFGLSGPQADRGEDLRPTIVEYVRSSPGLASLLGAASALIGIILSLTQKLGFRI